MFIIATKLAFRPAGIYSYSFSPLIHYPCRAIIGSTAPNKQTNPKSKAPPEVITEEDTTSTLKKQTGDLKYRTSSSKVSMRDAETRFGIKFAHFAKVDIPVSRMLRQAKPKMEGPTDDQLKQTKETVYENIVRYIEGEGCTTEFDEVRRPVRTQTATEPRQ